MPDGNQAPKPEQGPANGPAISKPEAEPKTEPDPEPTPDPDPDPSLANSSLSAIWANDGGDKVTQDELRATGGRDVRNSVWDGATVRLFGAKNEVVGFNLILEAGNMAANNLAVAFTLLGGPDGTKIESLPTSGDGIFDWTARPIELFFVRYLQIKGLSRLAYESYYDERHVPARFRRPWTGNGEASGKWLDRPDHDKYYPDIAVPLELVPAFDVEKGKNQGIWVDIYIPKTAVAGIYSGSITISEDGVPTKRIPIELKIRNFALPDIPNAKTMLFLGYQDINARYLASKEPWPWASSDIVRSELVRNRHFQMAHRHKISLIDSDYGNSASSDHPRAEWIARLDGSLFTAANGYDGPGAGVGNGIYSIGTYGQFSQQGGWLLQGEAAVKSHTDTWASWFAANAPSTEYFLYLIDESEDYVSIEQWASWINNNSGPGGNVMSLATMPITEAQPNTPSLDIPASPAMVGITSAWQNAVDLYNARPGARVYYYNGRRPVSGTFATEDDGVALREIAWSQYKKGIDRWFCWESTYYNNYQWGTGQTNVFRSAQTFGGLPSPDEIYGEAGGNYGNGDGVLFYPGTDYQFPEESYGLSGPIASLRLKHWRRGIQDVDYLTMAAAINPTRVQEIVKSIIPRVLWEVGVDNPVDPTYVHSDISWPTDPDIWENARNELADIIEQGP